MIIAQALKSPISFFRVTLSLLGEFLSFFFFSLSSISLSFTNELPAASVRSRYCTLNQAPLSDLPLLYRTDVRRTPCACAKKIPPLSSYTTLTQVGRCKTPEAESKQTKKKGSFSFFTRVLKLSHIAWNVIKLLYHPQKRHLIFMINISLILQLMYFKNIEVPMLLH